MNDGMIGFLGCTDPAALLLSMSSKTGTGIKEPLYAQWAKAARRDFTPASLEDYLRGWEAFFDHYAQSVLKWQRRNAGYHKGLASLMRFYVSPGASVLEIGSGTGDLLAAIQPARGVGIDISGEMIRIARQEHPEIEFHQMPAERMDLGGEKFDYVILSDLPSFLFDIRLAFEQIRKVCHPETRIVLNWYSRMWQPVLLLAEKLGLMYPQPLLNWTTVEDIFHLLYLAERSPYLLRRAILRHFSPRYTFHHL